MATLLFQIADLHRMQGNTLEGEWRYFGSESPSGNTWYNFDPMTYLECALAGMSASNEDAEPITSGGRAFPGFLELRRLYE